MKRFLLPIGLGFVLVACNSGSDNSENKPDSSVHTTHTTSNTSAGGQNHMKAMHDAMSGSMEQMKSMTMSGDPDHDFAMMMKHHHQGAIDMAQSEIAGGTDEQLKQMAQKMIDEQQKEIAEFDTFMQGKQPGGRSDYGQKAMGIMTPMSAIKMESGSLDAMFASMMIPHHQDAVKMAEEYLKVGKSAEMKKIAQSIIETQPKEIRELQNWLSNH